jgi:DNA-binding NarL/FixJ family response regulator
MERLLLLIEPRLLFRESLALLLEWQTGLGSVRAGSLSEARAILEEEIRKPACVVVNLDLPEDEGAEVLEELDGAPVLALIGSRNLERQAEAMRLGADEVLSTAGPVEKIAAAVERLVGR